MSDEFNPNIVKTQNLLIFAEKQMLAMQFDEAISSLERIAETGLPKNLEATRKFLLGRCYLEKRAAQKALPLLAEAVNQQKNNSAYRFAYGAALHMTGQLDLAEKQYRDVIRLAPTAENPPFNLARVLTDKADIDGAIRAYQLAITRNPKYTLAYAALGDAYVVLGKSQDAEVMLSKALALDKNCSLAWNGKGKNAERMGRIQEALAHFLQAAADEQFAEAKFNAARMYANLEQVTLAQQYFEGALKLDPTNEKFRHMASMFTREANSADSTEARMPDAYVREIFDQFAPTFDQSLVEGLQYQTPLHIFQLINPLLTAQCRSSTPLDIVDLGCGTGLMGAYVSKYAKSLVGVDISPKMLEKAEQRGYSKLVAVEIGTYLQSQPDCSVDVVLAVDVFVYFGQLAPTFAEVSRVLRDDGVFAFSVESLLPSEANAGLAYQLKATGRYQHCQKYILETASKFGLKLDMQKSANIRTEAGKPVLGELFCFIKG
jgi:predicted TPR repeat methyltransferase/predicted negative regulator of RcsB-dependent stress response